MTDDKMLDRLDAELDRKFASTEELLRYYFDRFDDKLDRISAHLTEINAILDRIDGHIEAMRRDLK